MKTQMRSKLLGESDGVRRLIKAKPGQKAFPDGADLSGSSATKQTPLDYEDT